MTQPDIDREEARSARIAAEHEDPPWARYAGCRHWYVRARGGGVCAYCEDFVSESEF